MSRLRLQPHEWKRFALAAVAGLALAAAFPKIGVAGCGWVAPGLILASAIGLPGASAFRVGYVAGLTHWLASLYWLLFIPVPFAPVVGWLALSAYVALYPAAWVWCCWRIYPAPLSASGLGPLLDQFLTVSAGQRLRWAGSCAALWVAGEMIQARLFSGFPWNPLGASQYRLLPVIQIAAITGVYGVSFLMVWFSVALAGAGTALARRSGRLGIWTTELPVPLLCAVVAAAYGTRRQWQQASTLPPTLKVALVQPSIPQKTIWNPGESGRRFQQVLALSEEALAHKPDLLVWPEAAVPSLIRWDTNLYGGLTLAEAVAHLVRRHRVWLVMGADDAAPNSRAPEGADYFNASFLLNPAGDIVASYRKRRLVMFGEYVPLARWLPLLRTFTQVAGDFTPGTRPVPFELGDLKVKTSVLICFEDLFPHAAREYVEADTDFLINLTNNGWFGEGAAQWQHAACAVFRAVENGLPLIRCTNNGLTCWIDPHGRMHEIYFADSPDVYRSGFKLAQVPLLAGQARAPTFYRKHGDWLGWACVAAAAVLMGHWWLAGRRTTAKA